MHKNHRKKSKNKLEYEFSLIILCYKTTINFNNNSLKIICISKKKFDHF